MNKRRVGWTLMILWSVMLLGMGAKSAFAGGSCPASPGDIIGQIRCGETRCGQLVSHMQFIGGSCQATPLGVCCDGKELKAIAESAETGQDILLWPVHPNGQPFNYLNGPVHIVDENGDIVLKGKYRAGEFLFDNGQKVKHSLACKN